MIGAEDLRNLVVESINARDAELLAGADLPGQDALVDLVQTMDERWPRMMMTRGDLHGNPVAIVWLPDRNEIYRQVGFLEVTAEQEGPETTLVEGTDPDLVAETPPGRNVAEWESATEIDRGEGRWI